jgi:hypothetical protein
MPWTAITGLMKRRLLVNWRVPLPIARQVLPRGVRPATVNGFAVAGLCFVRLEKIRPVGLPAWTGLDSENLAVRMAVEWDGPAGDLRKTVLIFHRQTASRVNSILCRRMGYGIHALGDFFVRDLLISTDITVRATDHVARASVRVPGNPQRIQPGSIFDSIDQTVTFFRGGECGYSPTGVSGEWTGARLRMHQWDLRPLEILSAQSTLLDHLFQGQARLDSAFIMRNLEHTWTPCGLENFGECCTTPSVGEFVEPSCESPTVAGAI